VVYHVGTMGRSRHQSGSHEGSGLSVSTEPSAWNKINGSRGVLWKLSSPSAKFVNAHKLSPDTKTAIIHWGVEHGFVNLAVQCELRYFDADEGETFSMMFATREEAELETPDWVDPNDVQIHQTTGAPVATQKLKIACNNSCPVGMVSDMLLTVFAESAGYDGVWWADKLDVSRYSAPRGVIFNSKLSSRNITNTGATF